MFSRSLHLCAQLFVCAGERFVPGVGRVNAEDMLKREVIHQLCIKPMAHSELTKALPEDVSIIYRVVPFYASMLISTAGSWHWNRRSCQTSGDFQVSFSFKILLHFGGFFVCRKPTGTSGKGMYELKEECFERYNPFFYHYTRAERSKVKNLSPWMY